MSEIKWIRIVTDIFDDEKMYAIECMPDGRDIELVWFKILCLAGKCNQNGFLTINNKIAYTDEMLSKIFRMEIGVVQRALETFQSLDMIEVVDDTYMVSNWMMYQSGERLEEYKEKNRIRQQRYRDKQKALQIEEKQDSNVTNNVTNNVNCSLSLSLSNNNNKKDIYSREDIFAVSDIIEYLNTATGKSFRATTAKTKTCINARLKEGFTVEDFKTVIDVKCKQWLKDDRMKGYLRPETLFGTKFEGYLNEAPQKKTEIPKETPKEEIHITQKYNIRPNYTEFPQEQWSYDEVWDAEEKGIITEEEAYKILG